jgi:RNA polymerase sigma factor (TIGR02999 family)
VGPVQRHDLDDQFRLVYNELRAKADRQFSGERAGNTLQPTALVHEAYLKMSAHPDFRWESREHFVAIASRAMRQVLIDHARRKRTRGLMTELVGATIDFRNATDSVSLSEVVAMDAAIARLSAESPRGDRHAQLLTWVCVGGMTLREAAGRLQISERQAQRDWAWARAWVAAELSHD